MLTANLTIEIELLTKIRLFWRYFKKESYSLNYESKLNRKITNSTRIKKAPLKYKVLHSLI